MASVACACEMYQIIKYGYERLLLRARLLIVDEIGFASCLAFKTTRVSGGRVSGMGRLQQVTFPPS
jgi:hypothetical protein